MNMTGLRLWDFVHATQYHEIYKKNVLIKRLKL